MASQYWNRKTFVLVTGASKGIGRAIAERVAELVGPESVFLLLSRDEDKLKEVEQSLSANDSIRVQISKTDLSSCTEEDLDKLVTGTLENFNVSADSFDHAVCFHNAGSLGDASIRCADLSGIDECVDYFRLNLVSMMILNAIFLRKFHQTARTVVNISSLCGIEPFTSLSLYCSGKAARDMFFKVLAAEEPDVRVLNYAPGPVETAMRNQIVDQTWDATLAENLKNNKPLTPNETVDRLVHLLALNRFKSGAHVDYFDPLEE